MLDLCKHRSEFWVPKLNHCLAVNLARELSYGKRVVAAYFSLPKELIRRSCEGMKKRLSMVLEAKGGHFKRD